MDKALGEVKRSTGEVWSRKKEDKGSENWQRKAGLSPNSRLSRQTCPDGFCCFACYLCVGQVSKTKQIPSEPIKPNSAFFHWKGCVTFWSFFSSENQTEFRVASSIWWGTVHFSSIVPTVLKCYYHSTTNVKVVKRNHLHQLFCLMINGWVKSIVSESP